MWGSFILSVAFGAVSLYLPGFLAFRALRASFAESVALAPLFSIFAYCALAILFPCLGIKASAPMYFAIAVAAAVLLLTFSTIHSSERLDVADRGLRNGKSELVMLAGYVAAGSVVGAVVFAFCFDNPDSIAETYDNVFHFALLRSYIESGNWSPFSASAYLGAANFDPPFSDFGYYPSCWHIVGALVSGLSGAEVSVAANAVNYLFSSIVFPSGMYILMSLTFCGERRTLLAGMLLVPLFSSFPWVLLFVWPLYPNAMSLSLVPCVLAGFILATGTKGVHCRPALGVLSFLLGVVCFAFAQPNSVFTCAVFLIPFCVWRIAFAVREGEGKLTKRIGMKMGKSAPVLAGTAFFFFAVIVWTALYKAPFLQGVVQYHWDPVMSKMGAIASVLDLSFVGACSQPLLALLVLTGVVVALLQRHFLWIACSYLLACLIFVFASSFDNESVKHFFSGFWYTDPYRIAAFASVFAMPLASLGLGTLCGLIVSTVKKALAGLHERAGRVCGYFGAVLPVLLVLASVFGPTAIPFVSSSGFSAFRVVSLNGLALHDMEHAWVYDSEERAFVEKVESVVSEDDLVLNQPYDGSAFAYSVDGLNVYYRSVSGFGGVSEKSQSKVIRLGLSSIESDGGVQHAVFGTGAKYVLILDGDNETLEQSYISYSRTEWGGVNSITDNTPGFEVVLSEGDMRLYKITALDG